MYFTETSGCDIGQSQIFATFILLIELLIKLLGYLNITSTFECVSKQIAAVGSRRMQLDAEL